MGRVKDNPNNHYDPIKKRWVSSGEPTKASTVTPVANAGSDFSSKESTPVWESGSDIDVSSITDDLWDDSEMIYSIDDAIEYEIEHPGCGGCDFSGDDFVCRCGEIVDIQVDEQKVKDNSENIVKETMRKIYPQIFPTDHSHIWYNDDPAAKLIQESSIADNFRTVTENDLDIYSKPGYYGEELKISPKDSFIEEVVEEMLFNDVIGKKFSQTYLGGYPLTAEGVKDFLASSGRDVQKNISQVKLVKMHSGKVSVPDHDDSQPNELAGRNFVTRGVMGIVDSECTLLDGYKRMDAMNASMLTYRYGGEPVLFLQVS